MHLTTISVDDVIDGFMYTAPMAIIIAGAMTNQIYDENTGLTSFALITMMLVTRHSGVRYRCTVQEPTFTSYTIRYGWMFLIHWVSLTAISSIAISQLRMIQTGGLSLVYGLLCLSGFIDAWWSKTPMTRLDVPMLDIE